MVWDADLADVVQGRGFANQIALSLGKSKGPSDGRGKCPDSRHVVAGILAGLNSQSHARENLKMGWFMALSARESCLERSYNP